MYERVFGWFAAALIACGGTERKPDKPPDPPAAQHQSETCDQVLAKIVSLMEKRGHKKTDEDRAKIYQECRDNYAKDPHAPEIACVLDHDGDDIVYCLTALSASRQRFENEAQRELAKLAKNLKTIFITNGAYPVGHSATLPARPCCGQPYNRCATTTDWAKDPMWTALDFEIKAPNLFQYSYASDGATARATAVGDLDCDGIFITYSLDMSATNGSPGYKLTEPPPNAD